MNAKNPLPAAAALVVAAVSAFAAVQPAETPAATRQALQDAIDAAANESPAGTVALGAGTFEIDAQLWVTGGVAVVGQGWTNTTIRQTATGDENNPARIATLKDGSRIEGVTVRDGNLRWKWHHGAGL